jgi:hypothetical protein
MSRMELPFSSEHSAAFDLEVFVQEAVSPNQRTRRPSPSLS